MRYVVTEIEGQANMGVGSQSLPGLSTHVIDVPVNRRVVFTARSEDYSRGRSVDAARAIVREQANTRCDLLNRLDEIARGAEIIGVGYTIATGRLFTSLALFHAEAERLLDRPVYTHEFADEAVWVELRAALEADLKATLAREAQGAVA